MGSMRTALLLAGVVTAMAVATGCATPTDDGTTTGSDEVVAGTLDWTHPEIGAAGECSATLVSDDTALTAAGCEADAFVVHRAGGDVAGSFEVRSVTRLEGFTLLRLAERVPTSIARPLDLAAALPIDGARVTLYGYGCAARVSDARKRSAPLKWLGDQQTTDRDVTCPGSPGAPVLDGAGRVVAMRGAGTLALVAPDAEAIRASLAPAR